MQNPTVVGTSTLRPTLTAWHAASIACTSNPNAADTPATLGYPQIVALLENGEIEATRGTAYACAASRGSQPSGTTVSAFSSATSCVPAAVMPRLTDPANPRLRALCSSVMRPLRASVRSQATSFGSGEQSSTTITAPGGRS